MRFRSMYYAYIESSVIQLSSSLIIPMDFSLKREYKPPEKKRKKCPKVQQTRCTLDCTHSTLGILGLNKYKGFQLL